MEEDEGNAERTDIAYGKEEDAEKVAVCRALVGKFVVDRLSWNIPSYENTGKHAA